MGNVNNDYKNRKNVRALQREIDSNEEKQLSEDEDVVDPLITIF